LIAYLGDEDENTGGNYTVPPHLHFGIRRGSRYDYPGDASDNRFTAGWTYTHPANLGWMDPTDFINVTTEISDISEKTSLSPHTFELLPNYPNPFNSKTILKIILYEPLTVNLNVYDINGRLISSLMVNELLHTGIHLIEWDGRDKIGQLVASGIYCYQLETYGHRKTGWMILLK
ncbi:MAG: T9SS type A sorting domain-containing protein, partial [bacterium]